MDMQARKLDRPQSGWQKVADRTGATLQECSSELRGCRLPPREGLKLQFSITRRLRSRERPPPNILADAPEPTWWSLGSLGGPLSLAPPHGSTCSSPSPPERFPTRRRRPWGPRPGSRTSSARRTPPLLPAPKDTNAFAWEAEEEGYPHFSDGRQTSGEELAGGEELFVGSAIDGELVPVSAQKDGVPRAPVRFPRRPLPGSSVNRGKA